MLGSQVRIWRDFGVPRCNFKVNSGDFGGTQMGFEGFGRVQGGI